MDCVTARKVYKTNDPLESIKEVFPEAWSFLDSQAQGMVNKTPDEFDTQVKEIVGNIDTEFRVTHRDDGDQLTHDIQELLGDITSRLLIEDHFSKKYNQTLYFNTVCCSGCVISNEPLDIKKSLTIQKAAVSVEFE
jgi:hypothetical protein